MGEGSQSLLYDICRLFLEPGDQVMGIGPCYAEFASDVGMWGADYDFVPLRPENRFAFDLNEMLSRLDSRHKLVYIDTPNNPTGQAVPLEQVEALVARAEELSIPIIVDEAYGDYLPQSWSAISLTGRYDNLAVLRSFSKAHGLAGARAGYGILPQQLCVPLDNITHPYICSSPARAIAQAALEDEGFLEHTRTVTAQFKAPFLRDWSKLFTCHTHPETPIFLLSHPDPQVELKRAFDPFHIKVVSGNVFVGLGKNSVRMRAPLLQDQAAVLQAIEEIDRTY
ncbi:MAG: histidinol-phosphate transaminase [Lawsonibacter sp.]